MIGNKQEEMSGKLQATSAAVAAASTVPVPSKDSSADVKRQIEALSRSLGNLAGDNSKILLELSELKEAVILLNEKGNFSDDYDEEEYDGDFDLLLTVLQFSSPHLLNFKFCFCRKRRRL